MQSFLLVSILLMTILIPARAARFRDERRGLRRMTAQMAMFLVLYVLALRFVYPLFE